MNNPSDSTKVRYKFQVWKIGQQRVRSGLVSLSRPRCTRYPEDIYGLFREYLTSHGNSMNVHCISLGCQYQSKVGPGSNDGRIYRLMTLVMDGCCLWLAAFKIGSDENNRPVSGGWCWRLVRVWTRFKVTAFICSWLNLSSRKRRCQIEHSVDGTNKIKKKQFGWCTQTSESVGHVNYKLHMFLQVFISVRWNHGQQV